MLIIANESSEIQLCAYMTVLLLQVQLKGISCMSCMKEKQTVLPLCKQVADQLLSFLASTDLKMKWGTDLSCVDRRSETGNSLDTLYIT